MRKIKNIPRIIKINKVADFKVYCAFNNGEYKIIDFKKLFKKWNTKGNKFQKQLMDKKVFEQVQLHEGTLQWKNLTKKIKLSNGLEFDAPFDLDPIVLYEESEPDEKQNDRYNVGHLIKNTRKELGLTQTELAIKSGTTKNYISRIENNKSDIELSTLRKIIEIGLNKDLQIIIR